VLRDSRTCCCGDERSGCRDVERLAAVPARSCGVDEVGALRQDGKYVSAHRLGAAGDLVGGLALQPERNEEAADLSGRRLARHDRVHHAARLVARQVVAVEQLCERGLDHRSRKFFAISRPWGVRTDSGWNWTPSMGSSR